MHIVQKAKEYILHQIELVMPQNAHEDLSLQELYLLNVVIRK